MARITLRQLLDHAAENDYGLPAYNINNMEQGLAIMEAAEAVRSAVAALAEAQKHWDAVQSDTAMVLRLAGRSTEGLSAFPAALQELTRNARRAGQVDVPTPGRVMA